MAKLRQQLTRRWHRHALHPLATVAQHQFGPVAGKDDRWPLSNLERTAGREVKGR
jgi:hypothetical protein